MKSFSKISFIMIALSICFGQDTSLVMAFFERALSTPAFENPIEPPWETEFADSLFSMGEFDAAQQEYQIIGWLYPMTRTDDYAKYQRALALIKAGKFKAAEHVLGKLALTTTENDVAYRAKLLSALAVMMHAGVENGIYVLDELNRDFPENRFETLFWRGWFHLLAGNLKRACEDFSYVANSSVRNPFYASRAYGIKRWLDLHSKEFDARSPFLARWLSGIIPGLGQIYAGNIAGGLNSALINGVLGYLTISPLIKGYITESAFVFVMGWSRYYFGGMTNAQKDAEMFNEKSWRQAVTMLMETFLANGNTLSEDKGKSELTDSDTEPQWLNGMSVAALGALSIYRRFITTQDAQECQFEISCSKFSTLAFKKRDPLSAFIITADRITRCNPFAANYYVVGNGGKLVDNEWLP